MVSILNCPRLRNSQSLVTLVILMTFGSLTTYGFDLRIHIDQTKHQSKESLDLARQQASIYVSHALQDLSRNFRRSLIDSDNSIEKSDVTLPRLDNVLRDGVNNVSTSVNATLDQMVVVAEIVRQQLFLDPSSKTVVSHLDDTINTGRESTEEMSAELFNNILHVIGEYFKGFVAAAPPLVAGRSIHLLNRRFITKLSVELRNIAEETFKIINNEIELILQQVDGIAENIKSASSKVWSLYVDTRAYQHLSYPSSREHYIDEIFDQNWTTYSRNPKRTNPLPLLL